MSTHAYTEDQLVEQPASAARPSPGLSQRKRRGLFAELGQKIVWDGSRQIFHIGI